MKKTLYFLAIPFLFLTNRLAAQNNNNSSSNLVAQNNSTKEIDWENFDTFLNENPEKEAWIFHTDEQHKNLLVDFETLNLGMLQELVVKNESGKMVFEDAHLFDLPPNTIYEVSLKNLPKGNYTLELRTHKKETVRHEFAVQ